MSCIAAVVGHMVIHRRALMYCMGYVFKYYIIFIVRFPIGLVVLFITFFLHFFLSWTSSLSISSFAISTSTFSNHVLGLPTGVLPCCCLPTPMILAGGGSHLPACGLPASFSVHLATSALRRDMSTNPGVTMWCVCG